MKKWVHEGGCKVPRQTLRHGGRLSVWWKTRLRGVSYWEVSLAVYGRAAVKDQRVYVVLAGTAYGVGRTTDAALADVRVSKKTLEEALAAAEGTLLAREAAERLGYQAPGREAPC